MTEGFCTKCKSTDIFVDDTTTEKTHRMGDLTFKVYMCLHCGYTEHYLTEHDREQVQKHLQDTDTTKFKNQRKQE